MTYNETKANEILVGNGGDFFVSGVCSHRRTVSLLSLARTLFILR